MEIEIGIKDSLFQLFLFFYFSQVLGLDPELAGLSSLVALVFDAISDPLVGMISDKWQSKKWGWRHPFMFASALPLGFFVLSVFFILPYPITKGRFLEIRAGLEEKAK